MQQPVPASFFGKDTRNPSFILASTLCLGVGRSPRPVWPFSVFCDSILPGFLAIINIFPPRGAFVLVGFLLLTLALARPAPFSYRTATRQNEQGTDDDNDVDDATGNRLEPRQTSRPDDDRFPLPQQSKPRLDWPIHLRPDDDSCATPSNSATVNTHISAPVSPRPIPISRPAGVSAHHSFGFVEKKTRQPGPG